VVINTNTGHGEFLTLDVRNGSIKSVETVRADRSNPDIVASGAYIKTSLNIGEPQRKLVFWVPGYFDTQTAHRYSIFAFGEPPSDNRDTGDNTGADDISKGNDKLIEIEGLNEIDPAIFTHVRNYLYDEVAILLPEDQRYDDDEEAK
jgi:hypothetical protein